MAASTMWVWDRQEWHIQLGENILTRPNCIEALSRVNMDVYRAAPYINALAQNKPQVALLYSPVSKLQAQGYLDETKLAYEGANFVGIPIGFITENQCANGGLAGYKLVIIPGADNVYDKTYESIKKYVDSGGTVIITGKGLKYDEYGTERDIAGLVNDKSGRVIVNAGTGIASKKYKKLISDSVVKLGLLPELTVIDKKGKETWGIEHRCVKTDGGYVMYVANLSKKTVDIKLHPDTKIKKVVDVIAGTTLSSGDVKLKPLDVYIYKIEF
jgi:beta-galactosidase GanA